jgi:tRNA (pseudouridine54-N1)-methyltransferase
MRTFIIRARKGTTRWERVRSQVGGKEHFEVVAHSVINAFFISSDFRSDVEVYIVLDSSEDFPHTIKLTSEDGLSLAGFHEEAVIGLIEKSLKDSRGLLKDETRTVAPGVQVSGFGFEKLISGLIKTRPLYLLDRKGGDIRDTQLEPNPIFILSDHLAMPKKTISGLKRNGLKTVSLGKKMLFASQCIVLLNDEMDRGC